MFPLSRRGWRNVTLSAQPNLWGIFYSLKFFSYFFEIYLDKFNFLWYYKEVVGNDRYGLLVKRLRRRPLTAETRVRFPDRSWKPFWISGRFFLFFRKVYTMDKKYLPDSCCHFVIYWIVQYPSCLTHAFLRCPRHTFAYRLYPDNGSTHRRPGP